MKDSVQSPRDRYQAIYNGIAWDVSSSFFIIEKDVFGKTLPYDQPTQAANGKAAVMAIATTIEKFKDACNKTGL